MHRQIKKFDDDSLKFKSSELRAFLLYLAVPVFFNSLETSFFYLLLTYVGAIRLLYEPIQNEADINLAEQLMSKYVYEFEEFFIFIRSLFLRYLIGLKFASKVYFINGFRVLFIISRTCCTAQKDISNKLQTISCFRKVFMPAYVEKTSIVRNYSILQ